MTEETIRAEFENFMSDDGKWPQAIERNGAGNYILNQAASNTSTASNVWPPWHCRTCKKPSRVP